MDNGAGVGLGLGELEPELIEAEVQKRKNKKDPVAELRKMETEARLQSKEQRMATGKKGGAATKEPAQAPAAPPEEVFDRSGAIDKIMSYRERFPHLRQRNRVDARSSVTELKDELHYIEMQLGSTGPTLSVQLFCSVMAGAEMVTRDYFNPLGLKLDGLGAITKANSEQFVDTLDELSIKYGATMSMSPEIRLAVAVGSLVLTVHSANNGDARLAKSLSKMGTEMKTEPEGSADL